MTDADEPVWIPILPDMSGFGAQLTRGLSGMRSTADRGGRAVGTAVSKGAEAGLASLRDNVDKTAKAQEDAAGRVRVAEAKLQDLRDSGRAKTGQIVAAEEALARSRRNLQVASGKAERATKDLSNGQEAAKRDTAALTAETRELDDAAEKTSKSADRLKGVLGGLAAGGAALLGKGVADLLGIDAANDRLAAQLDLTGPMAQRAGESAGRLFRSGYGESMDSVNSAIRGVQTNIADLGDLSDRELDRMGRRALDLSSIMGEDVGRVTRGVGQLVRNGLAKDATEGFDIITRAAQRLPEEMQGELLDPIEEYSADLGSLGLTGEQAFGAISAAVEAGARNTDLAADALREFSIRAVDGSKTTREGYQALGLDAVEMAQKIAMGGPQATLATSNIIRALRKIKDPVKQEAAGVALFGTRFEELGIDAISAMDPMSSKLRDVKGATDEMGKTLNDNFTTRMETWKRTAMGFVQDGLMKIADWGVRGFAWAKENRGPLTVLGVVLGSLVAGILVYTTTVRVVTAVTRGWAVVQALLNGTMRLNPIGLIITALVALAAGLVFAYKRSDTFRRIVDRAWAAIRVAVRVAWEGYIKPALAAFGRFVGGTLIPLVLRLWRGVIAPTFRAIGRAIAFTWRNVIQPAFSGLSTFLRAVVFPVIRFLWNNVVRPTFTGIGRTISTVWRGVIKPVLQALGRFVNDTVRPAFRRGVDAIGDIWEGLRALARRPVEFLVNTVYNRGIRAMMNKIPGVNLPAASFARGGWTGPGAKYKPAGIVHADEYVIPKESRRSIERQKPGLLDFIRNYGRLPGYAGGGRVWPLPGGSPSTYAGHDGVDFNKPGDLGAPFVAAAPGTVSTTGYSRGYGNAVFVRGGYGELVYGHALDGSIVVRPGQAVSAGQMLARVGSTGNSTGPHLHFGFPGGSYGAAMAFLNGASTSFAGVKTSAQVKAESRKDNILKAIRDLPALARTVWSNITGMTERFGAWGNEIKNAGVHTIRRGIDWADDKIPNDIPVPGAPDIPMPDTPIRSALSAIGIFDRGGWLRPGAAAVNKSGRPEPVFSADQWSTLSALTRTGARVHAGGDVGPLAIQIDLYGEFEQDVAYIDERASTVYRAEARADRLVGISG